MSVICQWSRARGTWLAGQPGPSKDPSENKTTLYITIAFSLAAQFVCCIVSCAVGILAGRNIYKTCRHLLELPHPKIPLSQHKSFAAIFPKSLLVLAAFSGCCYAQQSATDAVANLNSITSSLSDLANQVKSAPPSPFDGDAR